MKADRHLPSKELINLNHLNLDFVSEIEKTSGVNINKCYHCKSCAGGCHFYQTTDYPPNSVIRLVQLGLRNEALECSTIWLCVGCHTCSIQCPMGIDMAGFMDGLRQIAIREEVVIAEPDILNFHRDVLHTIKRHGRTHKLEVMLRYKARKWDWFSDLAVGLKMFSKGKLHLMPSKIKAIGEIRKIFTPRPDGVIYE
ncbi:MAG: 4Fe-4S dicluster domain-containing protein [Desulfobacterales bacterium]|nr:MAG: 4Fe-4S dicluster domain-containing protein [Desulfobacterales bacterium]